MANLLAAFSIMIAQHTATFDLVVRLLFAFLLNILVYLLNDFYDVDLDLSSGARDKGHARFLKEHRKHAAVTMIFLGLLLTGWAALYSPTLLVPLCGGAGICWIYSARLKRLPLADVASMALWGGVMPAAAVRLDSLVDLLLLGQLALYSACFETIQTLRDRHGDAAAGLRTTAIFLGEKRTRCLLALLIVGAATYCLLLLHRVFGFFILIAAALPVPLEPGKEGGMDGYWNRVRLIFGLVWIAVLVQIYLHGVPAGLIRPALR